MPINPKDSRYERGMTGGQVSKRDVFGILEDFAKIPQMKTSSEHVNPALKDRDLTSFLVCALYASSCDDILEIASKVREFYQSRGDIPINRRPTLLHINGHGVIFKAENSTMYGDQALVENEYYALQTQSNVFGLSKIIQTIQTRASKVPHISFRLIPNLSGILQEKSGMSFEVFGPNS